MVSGSYLGFGGYCFWWERVLLLSEVATIYGYWTHMFGCGVNTTNYNHRKIPFYNLITRRRSRRRQQLLTLFPTNLCASRSLEFAKFCCSLLEAAWPLRIPVLDAPNELSMRPIVVLAVSVFRYDTHLLVF